jgi:hypothetical protein
MTEGNGVGYRLSVVERQLEGGSRIDKGIALAEKHDLELHGERGIYKALADLAEQLRWTQRALWGLAVAILAAAASVAFG